MSGDVVYPLAMATVTVCHGQWPIYGRFSYLKMVFSHDYNSLPSTGKSLNSAGHSPAATLNLAEGL